MVIVWLDLQRQESGRPGELWRAIEYRYHWLIIADQRVVKINKDEYQTIMEGSNFKMGHRRPYWKNWSHAYPGQLTYRQRLIQIFRDTLQKLEEEAQSSIQLSAAGVG